MGRDRRGLRRHRIADGLFVYQATLGSYVDGSLIDALWPASTLLLGWAAWVADGERRVAQTTGVRAMVVPALSTLTGLAVLVTGNLVTDLNDLAVGLATAALLGATLRMVLTFSDNARMAAESTREALTDALTGLGNRRRLMRDLEDCLARGSERTIALFDLDGFKNYNDVFGHPAGDALLVRLARELEAVVAGSGEAYRLGGDEFCVLPTAPARRASARSPAASSRSPTAATASTSAARTAPPSSRTRPTSAPRRYARRPSPVLGEVRAPPRRDLRADCDALLEALHEREPNLRDHVGDVAELAPRVGIRLGSRPRSSTTSAAPPSCTTSASPRCRTRSSPSPARSTSASGSSSASTRWSASGSCAPRPPAQRRQARPLQPRALRRHRLPRRPRGQTIPLGARIVAACDAWDAMIATRPYRHALEPADALRELRRRSGTQFDPVVVRALCAEVDSAREPQTAVA